MDLMMEGTIGTNMIVGMMEAGAVMGVVAGTKVDTVVVVAMTADFVADTEAVAVASVVDAVVATGTPGGAEAALVVVAAGDLAEAAMRCGAMSSFLSSAMKLVDFANFEHYFHLLVFFL